MKNKSSLLKIAILAIAVVSQINTIASVIMADLAATFPDASPTAIQYVMQMGMIGGFPISLCVGFLVNRFRIKPMLIVGLAAITIGGGVPIILHGSLVILYACAFIVGAGQGVLAPLLGTMILTSFEGKDKDRMLGLNTTFSTGGATLLLLIAGPLAVSHWVNIYFLYFLAIPVLILVIALLPAGDKPAAREKGSMKAPIPLVAWIQCVLVVLTFVCYVTYPLNVAMFIVGEGLGDAAAAGWGMSIVTVAGAIVGIVFQPIVKRVKMYIGALANVFGLAGMLLLSMATSLTMVYLAGGLLGVFFGIQISGGGYVIGRICKPEQIAPAFSISMSFMTLGIILSPAIINTITPAWGGIGSKGAFITSAGIFGIALVMQFIFATYLTQRFTEKQTAQVEA